MCVCVCVCVCVCFDSSSSDICISVHCIPVDQLYLETHCLLTSHNANTDFFDDVTVYSVFFSMMTMMMMMWVLQAVEGTLKGR